MNSVPKWGIGVALLIAALVIAALAALIVNAPSLDITSIWHDPYYRHVTYFSFYQALLSSVLSVGLAIPVAHALSRRQFFARSLVLKLCATTLVLPVLVGVFGLLAIYGNHGLLARGLAYWDLHLPFSIYGLGGILLAHLFFNLPYAGRLLLQSLESIPEDQHKLCAHLGMSVWQKFKWVEWPRLRQQLPSIFGLVFMLCFTSFATVMALGGGPKSTTIELAIYQAIKFDFDLQSGAILALWQMVLCGGLALVIQRFNRPISLHSGYAESRIWGKDHRWSKAWDCFWIMVLLMLVVPPLGMVIVSGVNTQIGQVLRDSQFWLAVWASLRVALCASVLALGAGVAMLLSSRAWRLQERDRRADKLELVGTIILVTPGLVLSTGLFLLLRAFTDAFSMAWWVVVLVNALMALPYVLKTLAQPMLHLAQQYQLLCASLGMRGWARLRLVEWRVLRRPLASALAISFMLSIGDLSAIALFGSQEFRTLPLYLFQLLGSYQMEAAAVVALILFLFSMGCFVLVETLFKARKSSTDEISG